MAFWIGVLNAIGAAIVLAAGGGAGPAFVVLVIGWLAGLVYLLPWCVAIERQHPDVMGIAILNLLLGWTGLFWVVALVWSFSGRSRPEPVAAVITSSGDTRRCPMCDELVRVAALRCKHCGADLPPAGAGWRRP